MVQRSETVCFIHTWTVKNSTRSLTVFPGRRSVAVVNLVQAQSGHLWPLLWNCAWCFESSPWQHRDSTAPPLCQTCNDHMYHMTMHMMQQKVELKHKQLLSKLHFNHVSIEISWLQGLFLSCPWNNRSADIRQSDTVEAFESKLSASVSINLLRLILSMACRL